MAAPPCWSPLPPPPPAAVMPGSAEGGGTPSSWHGGPHPPSQCPHAWSGPWEAPHHRDEGTGTCVSPTATRVCWARGCGGLAAGVWGGAGLGCCGGLGVPARQWGPPHPPHARVSPVVWNPQAWELPGLHPPWGAPLVLQCPQGPVRVTSPGSCRSPLSGDIPPPGSAAGAPLQLPAPLGAGAWSPPTCSTPRLLYPRGCSVPEPW